MKLLKFVLLFVALSSCAKINRIMDGTENLPNQIDETNRGMKYTNEGIRKQKQSEALKMLKDPSTRANLLPVPLDMMAPARTLAESLTGDEALLFFKNYLIKLNTQQSADSVPAVDEEVFQHNRIADYYMLQLVAGFMPQATVEGIVGTESEQGAYQEILMAILKLRVDFNNDMMLMMGVLGLSAHEVDENGQPKVLNPNLKLDTLGKIEKAIEYNEKIEYVCNLPFASKIALTIQDFPIPAFDVSRAKKNWQIILSRAESDYKAQSLKQDPKENEKHVELYAKKYQDLLEKLKQKTQ